MKRISVSIPLFLACSLFLMSCQTTTHESNHPETKTTITTTLASWNEGASKKAIIDFVESTTDSTSKKFVEIKDRIACFDNDGCLWGEQPMYFQLAFALDQIKMLAPQHPEWKTKQPFKAVLEGDLKTVLAGGEKALASILFASHAGMSTETYQASVLQWMDTAIHPTSGRHYYEMIYQPMVELLQYLRENGYTIFIVSGGGIDFMRAWTEAAYGIPPYQVVGSSGEYKYVTTDSSATLMKLAELNFNDDKEGKPIGIVRNIGKRPVFAAGNSDGDYAMLQYTIMGAGPRFGMIVHHTDSVREVAYDRASSIGRLSKGLNDATKYNWLIVDMKKDWKRLYPFQ